MRVFTIDAQITEISFIGLTCAENFGPRIMCLTGFMMGAMPKSRFRDDQVVGIVLEANRDLVPDVAKRHGIRLQWSTAGASGSRMAIARTGDMVSQRPLEFYGAVARRLSQVTGA